MGLPPLFIGFVAAISAAAATRVPSRAPSPSSQIPGKVPSVAPVPNTCNLLANGDFETGCVGDVPDDWRRYVASSRTSPLKIADRVVPPSNRSDAYGSSGVVTPTRAHSGAWSIAYRGSEWQLVESGSFKVVTGTRYALTFWAYSTTARQNIRTEFLTFLPGVSCVVGITYCYRGLSVLPASSTDYVRTHLTSGANAWQQFTHAFTAAETADVRLNIGAYGVAGELFIDELAIRADGPCVAPAQPSASPTQRTTKAPGSQSVQVTPAPTPVGCPHNFPLLKNGDFEIGAVGQAPTNWTSYTDTDTGPSSGQCRRGGSAGLVSTDAARAGRSVMFSGLGWRLIESSTVRVVAGQRYVLGFWAYSSTSAFQPVRTEFTKTAAQGRPGDDQTANHRSDQGSEGAAIRPAIPPNRAPAVSAPAGDYVRTHVTSAARVWQQFTHAFTAAETADVRLNIGAFRVAGQLFVDDVALLGGGPCNETVPISTGCRQQAIRACARNPMLCHCSSLPFDLSPSAVAAAPKSFFQMAEDAAGQCTGYELNETVPRCLGLAAKAVTDCSARGRRPLATCATKVQGEHGEFDVVALAQCVMLATPVRPACFPALRAMAGSLSESNEGVLPDTVSPIASLVASKSPSGGRKHNFTHSPALPRPDHDSSSTVLTVVFVFLALVLCGFVIRKVLLARRARQVAGEEAAVTGEPDKAP